MLAAPRPGNSPARGDDVALLGRDAARLEVAAEELRARGVRALAVPADVANADEVEAAADLIEQQLGPIDIWVNDAMATVFAPVADTTAAEVPPRHRGDLSRPPCTA